MESVLIKIDNVPLIISPEQSIIYEHFNEFPNCCGAGLGLGEKLVPETFWGLRVSPACYIHDYDWSTAPPTIEAFHFINARFLNNLQMIVIYKSESIFLKHLRLYRCVTYHNAVDNSLIRLNKFWKTKYIQSKIGYWPEYSSNLILTNVRTTNNMMLGINKKN